MSLDALTPDEFMQLRPTDHLRALALYSERIGATEMALATVKALDEAQQLREDLGSYRSLRKVHETRLHEQLPQLAA